MNESVIEADYLIVGRRGGNGIRRLAGGRIQVRRSRSSTDTIARAATGTHAYPFVRLHQPSAFYGVNSRPLGSGAKDEVGLNKGYYELARARRY